MTASGTSVSILFQQLRAGEPGARDQLIECMQHRLQRLTARILQDYPRLQRRKEVNDVLQDLNVRLLRAIDAGVHPESSTGFFGLAAVNLHRLLTDEVRRPAGAVSIDSQGSSAPGLQVGTESSDPALLAQYTEFWGHVNLLPERQRSVFLMHYVMDISQRDVAEELGEHPREISRLWIKATAKLHHYVPTID